jgi:iron complex transport system substrate-binding protein
MNMKLSLRAATAVALLGTSLTFAATATAATAKPSCVVSMSPTATETLYAIGAASQVKAVDRDSNYPVGKLPKTRIDALNPSVEAVSGVCPKVKGKTVKPDLVVISYDANNIKANLTALGITVVEQNAAVSLADAQGQIRQLGALTGHAATANQVAIVLGKHVNDAVASVKAAASRMKVRASTVSIYYELDPTLYSITSDTFVGSLLHQMGVTNIADAVAQQSDYGYPQLSREYVISASPKVIFLADTKCCSIKASTVAARTGFASVAAVKYNHVIALDDDVASRWGPRLGLLTDQLAQAIKNALSQKRWTN